jgi:hypothetical protein
LQTFRSLLFRSFAGNLLLCFTVCLLLQGNVLAQGDGSGTEDRAPQPLRKWQIGAFIQGGFVPRYVYTSYFIHINQKLEFYSVGLEIGRQMRRAVRLGFLTGKGEALVEIQPLWIARYPQQTDLAYYYETPSHEVFFTSAPFSETIYGGSITPILLRWNFERSDAAKWVPWLQLGGGILRTNEDFPLSDTTSDVNFVPQAAAGVSLFTRPRRSVDLAFKFIHISNAGLGDMDPAIHDSLNFSLGYSWWK